MSKIEKSDQKNTQSYENELPTTSTADETVTAIPEATAPSTPKPKRTIRKKKAESESEAQSEASAADKTQTDAASLEKVVVQPVAKKTSIFKTDTILTIDAYDTVQLPDDVDDYVWHELQNAYTTKGILTGILGGIEKMPSGSIIAVLNFKGFRVVIPAKEMYMDLPKIDTERIDPLEQQHRYLNMMLGAEIDFIVCGLDSESRSVVGSRKEAMLRKRYTFYIQTDARNNNLISPGRIVQARVIAVTEKFIRVEIFGVDTNIYGKKLTWYWMEDLRDFYSIGETIILKIENVVCDSIQKISVAAEARSLTSNTSRDHLKRCRIQGKYAAKVTDVHKGIIYMRLSNGANAIAHSCLDFRTPGKKDDVSFVVTKLDAEQNVAIGIITRIIRQNL